jgi:undecaprenyl-diphosphatase
MEAEETPKRQIIGEKYRKFMIPLILLVLLVISFIFDSKIALALQSLRNPVLDYVLAVFSLNGTIMAAFLIIPPTIYLFLKQKRLVLKYWFSFALTLFVMLAIKMAVHRIRPFEVLGLAVPAFLLSASYSTWDFSFPSNHAALSSVSLPFLKGKFFWIWLVFSLLIAFSRVYFGFHYLSDVVAGMLISYLIAVFVIKWEKLA